MKKKLSIIFLLFVYSFVFSNEYILLENYLVTDYFNNPQYKLDKNSKIDIQNVYCEEIIANNVYFAKIEDDSFIKLEFCKNIDLKTELPDDFCSAVFENDGLYLFPEYAIDMVYKQDRNYLNNFEEKNIKDMTVYDDYIGTIYWYERRISPQLVSNIALNLGSFFGLTQFFVSKIKRINANEFLVYSNKIIPRDKDEAGQDYIYNDLFNKEMVVFRLKKDGDYLEVYVDKEKKPRETYCYVNNAFKQEIFNLVRNNNCNIYNLTWPRHADGSCDYDGSKKNATVQNEKLKSTTNVATNKTMLVTENLKLRSGEATSTDVLAVMQAGTKVKILELGKSETIDGINSNWVKVEVQTGAKDCDGKPIKAGTVGWCYGGYLKY